MDSTIRRGARLWSVRSTFDPNPFVNGIDTASYKKLRENPDNPLYNRALNGV